MRLSDNYYALVCVVWVLFGVFCVSATEMAMSTFAGGGFSSDSGIPALQVTMVSPHGLYQDINGAIYVAQFSNGCVQKIINGLATAVAGVCGVPGVSQDGIMATSTFLLNPVSVAVDSTGAVYVNDYGALKVKKVSPDGILSTVAGNGTFGYVDNEAGTSAPIGIPLALWVNTAGTLFFSAYDQNTYSRYLYYISSAGNANGYYGDGFAATSTQFADIGDMTGDSTGRIVFGDGQDMYHGGHVKAISATDRMVSTIMGSGVKGYNGEGLPATSVDLWNPNGVAIDESSGDVYASIYDGNRVQVLRASVGLVYTVAGNGDTTEGIEGGPATSGGVVNPHAMVWDSREGGQLFVADSFYSKVRRVYDPTWSSSPTLMPTVISSAPTESPTTIPSALPSVFVQPSPTSVGCAWSEEDDSCGGTLQEMVVSSSTSSSGYIDGQYTTTATTITRTYRKRT